MTLEGTQFSHYRLLTLIGKGGMGEVYLAEDTQVRRQVAAKLIRIETVQMDRQLVTSSMRLFRREASAIASLDHPSILPLYDHGETEIEGSHLAYLIIPYRPEGSLATWLRKHAQTRRLTLKQVVHMIQQASQGLQYAHDRAVMHLDVKPANFLIRSRSEADEYPDLLLSDFGIARLASATSSTSQHLSGTPIYMAPEQCKGQPVTASDQYALAIMAYELLTGGPPFQGPPMNVMFAHVQKDPEPVCKHNPLLPSAVDLVLQRALAKKPEERFPSVAAFAQDFQEAFQNLPEESILRPSSPTPPTLDASAVHPPAASETVSPADDTQLTRPLPPASAIALAVEKVMLQPTASLDPAIVPAPRAPIASTQDAIASPELATLPPPSAPARPNRRRSAVLAGILLLLILVLVTGGSLGIWRIAATAQAHRNATATALDNRLPGRIWHAQATGTSRWLYDVAWSGSQFAAVGQSGLILTSPDGHTWTAQSSSTIDYDLYSIAWSGSLFVAVGGSEILTSPDGHTWTVQDTSNNGSAYLSGIAWSGSEFVAVGGGAILTSPDGHAWTAQNTSANLESVTWSSSQFEAVGNSGEVLTSPDGHTWTTRYTGTSQDLRSGKNVGSPSVAWSGSEFVVVGGSEILTSPDGHTWTIQDTGSDLGLESVVWSGSEFVAVGGGGTILTSLDGRTWTPRSAGTTSNLFGVAWLDSQLVAVGGDGTILTSP